MAGRLRHRSDVAELSIEDGRFSECGVEEQGGLHVSGSGKLSVARTSFEDCAVGYSTEPVCLTLSMMTSTGSGLERSRAFRVPARGLPGRGGVRVSKDVRIRAYPSCDALICTTEAPIQTFATLVALTSCKNTGATAPGACARVGATAELPPPLLPRRRLQHDEQVCFDRTHGKGEYAIQVTDDKYGACSGLWRARPRRHRSRCAIPRLHHPRVQGRL